MDMRKILWLAALFMGLQSSAAYAETPGPDITEMFRQLQGQMAQMQRTIEAQNLRIQQLESRTVIETPKPAVPLEPSVAEAVPWLKGLKQSGDLRLRYENFNYYDKAPLPATSDDRDRTRFRFRLRWGLEKDFGDDWTAGFRLASGSATDNASTNVTLGNPGHFTFKAILIDKAYALYSPNGLKDYGPLKDVTVGAGKFDNPFLRYSTGILWDTDVTPEGLYEKATLQHVSTGSTKVTTHWTAGQFISNENVGAETDAQVYGYQAALNVSTKPVNLTTAVSYYDYPNWLQTVTSNTAGTSFLRTNTSALDNPRILDWYNEQGFTIGSRPVTLWQDLVFNVGSIDDTRADLHEVHEDDSAWGAGVKLGRLKNKGDWELHYGYYDIGANSVVAAFNDADFGGPGYMGHTNRFGHKFGLGYQLAT